MNIDLIIVIIVLALMLIGCLISYLIKYAKVRKVLDDYDSYTDAKEFLWCLFSCKFTEQELYEISCKIDAINDLNDEAEDEEDVKVEFEGEITYHDEK